MLLADLPGSGAECSPPSRRASSSSSSSVSTCWRTRSRCGSGPRDCRASLQNSGSTMRGKRHEKGVETRLDGETLVVRIPMRFQRRGGRKRIVAPDGARWRRPQNRSPTAHWSRPSRVRSAGSGCWRAANAGRSLNCRQAERISRSYICRVLRLHSPRISSSAIIDGRPTAGLTRLLEPFPIEWEKQREQFTPSGAEPSRAAMT